MPWGAMTDVNDGDTVYGATMDRLRENLEFLGALKWGAATLSALAAGYTLGGAGFAAKASANQTIAAATDTLVTFDTEERDSNGAFATSRFTVPTGLGGTYLVTALLQANTGITWFEVRKNGANILRGSTSGGGISGTLSQPLELAAADYIELWCRITAGGDLQKTNHQAAFGAVKVA